jgi:hypothetical protein
MYTLFSWGKRFTLKKKPLLRGRRVTFSLTDVFCQGLQTLYKINAALLNLWSR